MSHVEESKMKFRWYEKTSLVGQGRFYLFDFFYEIYLKGFSFLYFQKHDQNIVFVWIK